jgi:hypothetical protein
MRMRIILNPLGIIFLGALSAGAASAADPQAMLDGYVKSAVAAETCRSKALSMVEELNLGRLVKAESGGALSSVSVLDGLSRARQGARPDCAAAAVQAEVKDFVDRVLPKLRWGSAQPVAGSLPIATQ